MITGLVTNNDIVIFNRVLQDDQHLFEMKMSAGGEYKVGSDQFGEPHFMIASTYDLADILPDEYNEAFGVDAHLALEGNVIRSINVAQFVVQARLIAVHSKLRISV